MEKQSLTPAELEKLPEDSKRYWQWNYDDAGEWYEPATIPLEEVEKVLREAIDHVESIKVTYEYDKAGQAHNTAIKRAVTVFTTALNNIKQLGK